MLYIMIKYKVNEYTQKYAVIMLHLTIDVKINQDELNSLLVINNSRRGLIVVLSVSIEVLERRMKSIINQEGDCIDINIRVGGSFWVVIVR